MLSAQAQSGKAHRPRSPLSGHPLDWLGLPPGWINRGLRLGPNTPKEPSPSFVTTHKVTPQRSCQYFTKRQRLPRERLTACARSPTATTTGR